MTKEVAWSTPDRSTVAVAMAAAAAIVVLVVGALAVVGRSGAPGSLVERQNFTVPYGQDPLPSGTVREFTLTAATGVTTISGAGPTDVWAFNGSVPGPEIRIGLGDTVRVTVTNDLQVPTSVHWHGIRVPHSMDGVPGVTQAPIAPGESFVYEFTPPDAGTFWYHSHKRGNEQLERGLYGAFVVEDDVPDPYTQDVTLLIDDWLLKEDGKLDPDFDFGEDIRHNGRWGSDLTINGVRDPGLNARPGERLRLRLVNTSTARIYTLDFGLLQAVGVAVDGLYAGSPLEADGFVLAPGNRLDVDVTIPVDASGVFQISDGFTGGDPLTLVAINVEGTPVEPPSFDPPNGSVPDWSSARNWHPDRVFELALTGEEANSQPVGLAGDPEGDFRWTINGRSWPDASTHIADLGGTEKLRFVNDSSAFHPMHLHGQFFQVIARDGVPVREGHFRDVVLVGAGETVDVVVVATDEGTWILHCHIQLHAEYGMATLYEVSSAGR